MRKIFVFLAIFSLIPCIIAKEKRLKSAVGVVNIDPSAGEVIEAGEIIFHYDSFGKLYQIEHPEETYTINYDNIDEGYLIVNIDIPKDDYYVSYIAALDETGKVDAGERIEGIDETNDFSFLYSDNRITSFSRIAEYSNYFTKFSYESNNLSVVESFSADNPDDVSIKYYEYSGDYNIHGLNMVQSFFMVDLNGLEILAQAGFLGVPSSEFPSSIVESDGTEHKFAYEFDEEGYLVLYYDPDVPEYAIQFNWEDASEGINEIIISDQEDVPEIYLLDGTSVSEMQIPGLYIVREKDGACRKILKNN